MGQEHAPETVWKAQELYCSDRLPFLKVAEITGVADSSLRRWADTYGWREKREELARAEADIRADKVLARSKTIKALLNKPDPNMAFAVSALESLALKEAEAARTALERSALDESPALAIETPADAVAALKQAIERHLAALLTRPAAVNLKAFQEVQKCLALLQSMQAALPVPANDEQAQKGITAEMHDQIMAVLTGKVEV
jgi:uncharacterized protein YjcR